MSLPHEHLVYPFRAWGMDHERYPWRRAIDRPAIVWPGNKTVALMIVVPIEHHMLNPSGKPFKHPGAMQTPYPDLRHYTTRDYGNRVGIFRLLKVLRDTGQRATMPVNAALLARIKPLVEAIQADGHEIAAYGWDTDALHCGGLDPETEKRYVANTRAAFTAASLHPTTWMSPARNQSFNTPDLIRAEGFEVCLDWEMDAVPVAMQTAHGSLCCVPLFNELDDRKLLIDQRQTEAEWRDQMLEAASFLKSEHERYGGQVLSFSLTPYVSGQPFRIWAVREALGALGSDPQIWSGTAAELARAAQ
ncbi:MAG: polysaccharide deacetylase family protein [Caulobacterales bacterium]|jgi:peptidoglycan/xylan/chitin deacetylase (PgdA/CDA1 family)